MLQAGKKEAIPQELALLGGLSYFLSTIEYMIPKPLPFMRLGIANLALMLGIDILSFPHFLLLVFLKVLGQAVISGSLLSYVFLFSVGGTLSSALCMYGLRKLIAPSLISFTGISTVGALVSNGVQLLMARFIIFGESAFYLVPPVLLFGFITGFALGAFCESFLSHSQWYAEVHTKRISHESNHLF
ncbi:MAG: Gx transporter family protein [Treponemataceae bacterium]|nr:Gx transporter family protein [Treponemataceae bacterium]